MVGFTDDAWPDGEERTYLTWDYIQVPGKNLTLKMEKVNTYELVEKLIFLNIMFHALMERFQLELIYCFTFIFHRRPMRHLYFCFL
jgi:hypothetical protein